MPETTLDSVNPVPATDTVLSAPRLTVPDSELVPVLVARVPPLRVMASAPRAAPWRSSVAALATVVPPAVVPRPAALLTARVPAETVVAPVKVLVPESVSVPAPVLVRSPVPLSKALIADAALSVHVRVPESSAFPVIANVPAVMSAASKCVPVEVPRVVRSLVIVTVAVPALMLSFNATMPPITREPAASADDKVMSPLLVLIDLLIVMMLPACIVSDAPSAVSSMSDCTVMLFVACKVTAPPTACSTAGLTLKEPLAVKLSSEA